MFSNDSNLQSDERLKHVVMSTPRRLSKYLLSAYKRRRSALHTSLNITLKSF